MSVKIVHRPARITTPIEAPETIALSAPPPSGDQPNGFPIQSLLPIVGSLSSITMMVVMRGNPLMVVIGAMILVVALVGGVGMAFTSRATQARQRRLQRERYLDYLEITRADIRARGAAARDAALVQHPAPRSLVAVGADPARRWERRPHDADFLHVRVGTTTAATTPVALPAEENPTQPFDPIMKSAADQLVHLGGTMQDVPTWVDLSRGGDVSIIGERSASLSLARAMAAQIASFHAPEEVHMAAIVPASVRGNWIAFDLFPHANRPAPDSSWTRRIAPSAASLLELIGDEIAERVSITAAARRAGNSITPTRLVIFVDQDEPVALSTQDSALSLADVGITVVHLLRDRLLEPSTVTARITITDDLARVEYPSQSDDDVEDITLDSVSSLTLELIARPLAGLRLIRPSAITVTGGGVAADIEELLGLDDIESLDPATAWRERSHADFLRVPIGVDDNGEAVLLDIKESAQLGMGPHGICIGATGSGKSELLRTLILELAMTHSPEDLSMILVDYKGGAAFAPFVRLPHIAGVIDNLADDPQLTERARASINGEVVRRQRMLKDAGSVPSIGHYRELRKTQPELAPMPHLFLVIDEFGELLTAEPDFVDLLLTIGRIGRSIGVHLLLSSQRIEGGKLRGLDTYLSYRIGLRTFSEAESTVVLDTPDAYHLPAVPGFGYLKVDTSVYTRFRSGYVSGPLPVRREPGDEMFAEAAQVRLLTAYDTIGSTPEDEESALSSVPQATAMTTTATLLDAAVERLAPGAAATQPVWLPPLPTRVTLGSLLPSDGQSREADASGLSALIGLIDDPTTQSQSPFLLDMARSGGHVSVTGAQGSGRSTFLRTIATSLAFTHTPRQVSIYGMDLTGGGLSRLEAFPHVGGVATRGNRERLERLLEEIMGMLAKREEAFRVHNLDSVADMRRQHAKGLLSELPSADVILLIDGAGLLRTEFENLEPSVMTLLERGSSFGVHLVFALTRWSEVRMSQQSLIGTRVELKLNDAADSQIARKLSQTLRADEPGRALTDDKKFAQIALPVLEEVEGDDIGEALEEIARTAARQWEGPEAAPIRLLPDDLSPAMLPTPLDEPRLLPLGLRQDSMTVLSLDLENIDLHMLVFGDSRAGKTTLLRGVIQGAIDRHTDEELVVALMDSRSNLLGDIPEAYLGGHAKTGRQARQLAEAIAMELDGRQSNDGSGPRILVIADDFDMLASGGADPLGPLVPYLASARDLRFNVVVARPVAGGSRAMFDPAMQSLRDTGGTTVIMSGDRSEGQLLPKVFAEPMAAGRGRIVRRGGRPTLIQVANFVADAPALDPQTDV